LHYQSSEFSMSSWEGDVKILDMFHVQLPDVSDSTCSQNHVKNYFRWNNPKATTREEYLA
jgi:hypothetical protein